MEMVESVDDLKSSRSIKGTHGPDFQLLDARIASALNKIIQNGGNESSQRRPSRKTDCFLDLRNFRVTGANDSVENDVDLFTVRETTIFRSSLKNGSVTQIPSDDILEHFVQIKNTRV